MSPPDLTNAIECRIRSTVAARSLTDWQARILAWRIARLVRDELEAAEPPTSTT